MPRINIVKFREDVKAAQKGLRITQKQLAKEAGVGHALLSKLFNKRLKYPTHKSVAGLCSALGLDAADYYVDPLPEPQREDVAKAYTEAKATLARANSMLDDVQEKIDELKATAAEDTPEAVANDLAEERLAALEAAQARIKEFEEENAEKPHRANGLTIELHADDRLLSDLLKFLANLKIGVDSAEN